MRKRNKPSLRRCLLAAWLTIVMAVPVAIASPAPGRDPWLWPFAPASPWNTPLGSLARFSGPYDPRTLDLTDGGALIHAGTWGMPLYHAAPDDPWVEVRDQENARAFRIRVPVAALPDPMGDGHMYVVEPGAGHVLEMYRARRIGTALIETRRAFRVDLRGSGFFLRDGRFPGVRAMDASGFGGVLRAWEVRSGRIRHALTFLLPYARLEHGPVWPSGREDFWGVRKYTGNIPIGTLIGIPGNADLAALPLSPSGLALAHALQDYGAYCDDSVGTDAIVLTAEGAAETEPGLAGMRRDFPLLQPLLRVVLNNTPDSPAGGGVPRAPAAPELR